MLKFVFSALKEMKLAGSLKKVTLRQYHQKNTTFPREFSNFSYAYPKNGPKVIWHKKIPRKKDFPPSFPCSPLWELAH